MNKVWGGWRSSFRVLLLLLDSGSHHTCPHYHTHLIPQPVVSGRSHNFPTTATTFQAHGHTQQHLRKAREGPKLERLDF